MNVTTTDSRVDARSYMRRFALSTADATTLAEHPEHAALLVAIEAYRTQNGQCLPPSCPLVCGMLRDALRNDKALVELLRWSDGKLSPLTVETVCDWRWVRSPEHRGRVPYMTRQERAAWRTLSDSTTLSRQERELLNALTRKLRYRADREIESW